MNAARFIPIFLFYLCISASKSHAKLKNQVIKLDDSSWRNILVGEWLVKFYAPWCPACKAIAPVWEKVADWSEDLNIKVAEIDVSEEAGLSGRFFVTALPTIYHVRDGDFRRYTGSRSEDDIISYIEDQRYNEIEKVTWWKHPNSIQMSLLSSIFKISMRVRVMHNTMTDEWGFPYWLSYLVFALATILAGLLLGLVFVIIADSICPPRPPTRSELNQPLPEGIRPKPEAEKKDVSTEKEPSDATDEVIDGEKKEEESTVRRRRVGSKGDVGEETEDKETESKTDANDKKD